MSEYLLHYKEEDMPLIMDNNISQITSKTTPTDPYPFQEILQNQIEKWLPYVSYEFHL